MDESQPTTVGPYRILDVLGEGGMGTVYLAEQKEPIRRRVALKIIKLGMDTREVVARFEVERQALAMMNHPNIAKVLDAGATAEGRPYFVMEHVPGVPITTYCDKQKLGLDARLALFVQVCRAVQHAHQNGVMHRDLKPSNILVQMQDVAPTPKVIDFGVAKATNQHLTERTLFTEQGRIIGTPEYMSPEQAEMTGLNVDTRTDVYSLGVLLYELITGALPFDPQTLRQAGYLEIQRLIREQEPPRPSTRVSTDLNAAEFAGRRLHADAGALVRALRGDLDWITMRALEKDPARRYQTASELAVDVERHRRHEPVEAGPPSLGYRARKLMRRHRGPVLAVLAVVAALAVGLVVSLRLYFDADAARAEARENERIAAASAAEARLAKKRSDALRVERERALAEVSRERNARQAALERTRGLLLAHQSHDALAANPTLALLLAVEAAERAPGAQANDALLAALDASRELRTFVGHAGLIESAAFSPDGARVVTGSRDRTARVWDVASGRALHVLGGHDGAVRAVFDPDAALVATGDGRAVRLWDARTGSLLRTFANSDGAAWSVRFSRDGGRLLGTAPDGLRVWSAAGEPLAVIASPEPWPDAVFAADGASILSWSRHGTIARLWSVADGAALGALAGHEGAIRAAAFARGGREVVTASEDGTARFWDVATGGELRRFTCDERERPVGAVDLAVSPDGATIAVGFGSRTTVVDVASGKALRVFLGCFRPVYHPDGDVLLFETTPESSFASLWSIASGEELGALTGCAATDLAFAADGTRVLSWHHSERTAAVWSLRSGLERRTLPGVFASYGRDRASLDVARDRLLVLDAERRARVVDVRDGRTLAALATPERLAAALFDPRRERILTVGGQAVRIFDVEGARELQSLPHERPLREARFTPDGRHVVTVARDGLRLWDPASGAVLRQVADPPDRVVFSADGAVAATLHLLRGSQIGSTLRVWRGDFSEELRGAGPGRVESVALGPDGKQLFLSGQGQAPELVDAASGRVVGRLEGHAHPIVYGEFSADGERLLTASFDGTARVWDAATCRERFAVRVHDVMGTRVEAFFAEDDSLIVTLSGFTGLVQVWSAADGEPLLKIPERCSGPLTVEAGRVLMASANTTHTWPLRALQAARDARPRRLTHDERQRFDLLRAVDERAARLVTRLRAEHVLTEDVLAALATDASLDAELREAAADLAREHGDPTAFELNDVAWRIVARPDASDEECQEALRKARAACRLAPDLGTLLNTLGVALYRTGAFADALATLRRSDELNGSKEPADVAFLALTLHALQRSAEAETERARLRELMTNAGNAANEENRGFVREVDQRFGK